MLKDFFYFTKTERRGILVLVALVAGILFISQLLSFFISTDASPLEDRETFEREYAEFRSSLKEEKVRSFPYDSADKIQNKFSRRMVKLVEFDPNTVDSATFVSLGLPPWMARNILRYRAKQGRFRRPEDFRKIYGLTEEQYLTLSPYIRIANADSELIKKDTAKEVTVRLLTESKEKRDIVAKYKPGTVIDLNRADTAELKKIPGIGSGIARRIVDYRRKLGGFYRVEQLGEIHLKVNKLRQWFSIDTTLIHPLPINEASVERMMRHPYLNFYQAKAIWEHRRKNGDIGSLKELSLYEEFSTEDLERLKAYIRLD